MADIRKNIAANIAKHRKLMKLSQKELAETIGAKSFTTVSTWERAGNVPDVETLFKLCTLFNISVDEMYGVKQPLDKEVNSMQGLIAILEEIYGNVEFIEGVKEGKTYSYFLIGIPPDQFVLLDKDIDTIFYVTENAITPMVERMKDTRSQEEIINDLIAKNKPPPSAKGNGYTLI